MIQNPLFLFIVMGLVLASGISHACMGSISNGCGPYKWSHFPMSNGYNTYVELQDVGASAGTTGILTAADPSSWSAKVNAVPYGYGGVQIAAQTQQLMNDWCPASNTWAPEVTSCGNATYTPLSALSAFKISYVISSPSDVNSIYEFATDSWNTNYPDDVMEWADTSPSRCTNNGLDSSSIIGQANFDGQAWTVYRYGSAGGEIVFILDGSSSTDPVDTGTCAQQTSGTIDVLAAYEWLVANGYMSNLGSMTIEAPMWEITSADNTTFTMENLSMTATVSGSSSTVTALTSAPTTTASNTTTITASSTTSTTTLPSRLTGFPHEYDYLGIALVIVAALAIYAGLNLLGKWERNRKARGQQ